MPVPIGMAPGTPPSPPWVRLLLSIPARCRHPCLGDGGLHELQLRCLSGAKKLLRLPPSISACHGTRAGGDLWRWARAANGAARHLARAPHTPTSWPDLRNWQPLHSHIQTAGSSQCSDAAANQEESRNFWWLGSHPAWRQVCQAVAGCADQAPARNNAIRAGFIQKITGCRIMRAIMTGFLPLRTAS